jgi:hypothetical protein
MRYTNATAARVDDAGVAGSVVLQARASDDAALRAPAIRARQASQASKVD